MTQLLFHSFLSDSPLAQFLPLCPSFRNRRSSSIFGRARRFSLHAELGSLNLFSFFVLTKGHVLPVLAMISCPFSFQYSTHELVLFLFRPLGCFPSFVFTGNKGKFASLVLTFLPPPLAFRCPNSFSSSSVGFFSLIVFLFFPSLIPRCVSEKNLR